MTTTQLIKARASGLNLTSLAALIVLGDKESLHLSAIAAQLHVSTAAMTGTADALEGLGFATRNYSKGDRRTIQLEISPRGKFIIAGLLAAA